MNAFPDGNDPSSWVACLLQSSDSFYPTGAYAHSFGLEGLVQDGCVKDRATLRTLIFQQALPQLSRTDLPVASHAWEAAGQTPESAVDWELLEKLCHLGSALRGTREARMASEAIGRQRLDLLAGLRGGFAEEFNRRAIAGGWPRPSCVAAAIEGRVFGAPREAVLAGMIYSAVAGLLAAAMKLLRLGQNASQSLLVEAMAAVPALVREAVERPLAEIGAFNPWWDIASARHERADFRLFIS